MATIIVNDPIHPDGVSTLEDAGHTVVETPEADEFDQAIASAKGLIVRSATKVTPGLLERAENLQVIGRAGIGVDNIDLGSCEERGIVVANTPSASTNAVAELTLAHILAVHRNLPMAITSMREGKWEKKACRGNELAGRILGLVGIGRIGARVAELAQAFGMTVEAYDPYVTDERAEEIGVRRLHDEVTDLAERVDVVSIHTPLTPETEGIVGKRFLEHAREGLVVVNCSRGGIVDEAALLEAIEAGKVHGAGLDVFEEEPPGRTLLTDHHRVSTTPHIGAQTEEAQRAAGVQCAEAILAVLQGGEPESRVV